MFVIMVMNEAKRDVFVHDYTEPAFVLLSTHSIGDAQTRWEPSPDDWGLIEGFTYDNKFINKLPDLFYVHSSNLK